MVQRFFKSGSKRTVPFVFGTCLFRLSIIVGIFLVLEGTLPVYGGKEGSYKSVLELSSMDFFSFSQEKIIMECSAALGKKGELTKKTIGRLYQRRGKAYGLLGKISEAKKDY